MAARRVRHQLRRCALDAGNECSGYGGLRGSRRKEVVTSRSGRPSNHRLHNGPRWSTHHVGDQMNSSKTKWIGMAFAVGTLVACASSSAVDTANQDRPEVEQLLGKYEVALNANDVQGVVKLYTDDNVLMPQE